MEVHQILLVDDDELVLNAWKYTLESEGHEVKTALSGAKALESLSKGTPDIIFTDLVMPEMNGVELCSKAKAVYPGVEVVLISGHPGEIEKLQMAFLNAGGKDLFLRKPLLQEEIRDAVKTIMDSKK